VARIGKNCIGYHTNAAKSLKRYGIGRICSISPIVGQTLDRIVLDWWLTIVGGDLITMNKPAVAWLFIVMGEIWFLDELLMVD
jgi:hypothetical protein